MIAIRKVPFEWTTTIFLSLIHLGALLAFVPAYFTWPAVATAFFLHWLTLCLGITLGFHRLLSHRSYRTHKTFEYFLAVCGTLACQGGPILWVGMHRLHHRHPDKPGDPHDSTKGFWWSHMSWILHKLPEKDRIQECSKDIANDPFYKFLDANSIYLQTSLAFLLYALGGWAFVIWGIFVRCVVVYHSTWLVNSAGHRFGYISYISQDKSKNCWWVAVLTYGEGWHNNHHAFQYSARHGLMWWELDLPWLTLKLMMLVGLVYQVNLPKTAETSALGIQSVNVEHTTSPCCILMGESTLHYLDDQFETQPVGELTLKGKDEKIRAYCVVGSANPNIRSALAAGENV